MLYDRWLRVALASPDCIALRDLATGRSWTFRQLAAEADSLQRGGPAVVFAEGSSADFILSVLRAWRSGAALCPVEAGHARPEITGDLPCGVVHLKTTSATTGAPRLVAFAAAQLMADAQNITETMGLRPDCPNLGVISLAHSYGFSNLVLPLLLEGIPLFLIGSTLPEAIRRAAAIQSAVSLPAVPALWQAWQDAGAIPPNVRLAISAGAPLPLALEQAVFAQHGLKIHNFYGSSECGGIAFDSTATPRHDATLAGAPLRNVKVSIAEDGCLEVRGAAVAQTYWPEPGPSLGQSVFRTSDLGVVLDGLVYLHGRATDQINVAGRKVLPEVIERVLAAHPQVRSCLAFGVPSPDTQRGEMIVACVASTAGLNPESLKQFALVKLPAWQVPRQWWFVEALDANGRGKLSRAAWRKCYLETAGKERL
jgi:long-chain acyl-CoA synthetase